MLNMVSTFLMTARVQSHSAMRACVKALKDGYILGVFPEGTRCRDTLMEKPKTGVAMIALRSGVPLLPVYIDETWTVKRHIESFRSMCKVLTGSTEAVVISFIDLYEKVKRNFPEASTVPFQIQLELTRAFVEIAGNYGMTVRPCGESKELEKAGADCSGCMTQKVFEKAVGQNLILPANPNNRKECACYITGDIGAYNSCGHFCRYCYANADRNAVIRSMKQHDPKSPLLIGHLRPEDKITQAKQISWIDPQMRLEDYAQWGTGLSSSQFHSH